MPNGAIWGEIWHNGLWKTRGFCIVLGENWNAAATKDNEIMSEEKIKIKLNAEGLFAEGEITEKELQEILKEGKPSKYPSVDIFDPAAHLLDGLDKRGFRLIWSMKPFDEDCFHKYYAPGEMPKYGAIRRPSELQVNAVLRATGHDFLILPALRVFLQIKCNAQNLSGWGWNEIMTALSYYQKSENERSQREMKQQMERDKEKKVRQWERENEQKVQWERDKRLSEQVLQQNLLKQDRKAKSDGSEQGDFLQKTKDEVFDLVLEPDKDSIEIEVDLSKFSENKKAKYDFKEEMRTLANQRYFKYKDKREAIKAKKRIEGRLKTNYPNIKFKKLGGNHILRLEDQIDIKIKK